MSKYQNVITVLSFSLRNYGVSQTMDQRETGLYLILQLKLDLYFRLPLLREPLLPAGAPDRGQRGVIFL